LLAAASPLAVYYSQETRMYAQVTLFGLLSTYLLLRALDGAGQRRARGTLARAAGRSGALLSPAWWWVGYVLAALACVYSQYVGVFVLGFHGLYVLLFRWRRLVPFVLAAVVVVLGYAPWLGTARESLAIWPSTSAFAAGPGVLADASFRFTLGLSAAVSPWTIGAAALALLVAARGAMAAGQARSLAGNPSAAMGTTRPNARASVNLPMKAPPGRLGVVFGQISGVRAPASPRTTPSAVALALLYLLVPIGAMFLLGYRKPIYNPKFALIALPGFLLLLASGISRLGWFRCVGLPLALAMSGFSLAGYYFDPRFARDDYRGVARFIQTSGRAGDAIILDAPGQEQIFPYYYHGALPEVGLPEDRPMLPEKTSAALQRLNERYRRLWLVLYGTNGSDPSAYVEKWLASKDYEIQNSWFGNVRLAAFAIPGRRQAPNRPLNVKLGQFARLTAYSLAPNPVASGDVLQLGLQWRPEGPSQAEEKVFTHVIDAEGNIWAQRDSEPVGGARPTTSWKAGDTIDDNYGLLVLPGTPPGEYRVEVGMYAAADGKRLPVTSGGSGDRLLLSRLQVSAPVQPPSVDELRIPHTLSARLGPVRLLGYGTTLVGQDQQRDRFRAGDTMQLTLFWQAIGPTDGDAHVTIELRGNTSSTLASRTLVPQHPTSRWNVGDRYRDQYRLVIPDGMAGGAELLVGLDGGAEAQLTRLRLG
ncbi:MAG: hypothetical protein KGJ86_07975, partial [Chloroflexota bacterium]|nr:hypothetical protein [Chloroflexota bacterium]